MVDALITPICMSGSHNGGRLEVVFDAAHRDGAVFYSFVGDTRWHRTPFVTRDVGAKAFDKVAAWLGGK